MPRNTNEDVKVTDIIKGLRKRAGLSMEAMATQAGYKGASSIQRYENPAQFHKRYLPYDVVERFALVLEGRGTPPIQKAEVFALAGPVAQAAFPLNSAIETTKQTIAEDPETVSVESGVGEIRDLPIFDTGFVENGVGDFVLLEEALEYARRPASLIGAKGAYAFYVPLATMEPKLPEGSLQAVHPNRRIRAGDDAIIQVSRADAFELISFLVRVEGITGKLITGSTYEKPSDSLSFNRSDIVQLGKVLSVEDLIG